MKLDAVSLCKQAGLKNMQELSNMSQVCRQTLYNWHDNKPVLFKLLIAGVLAARLVKDCELSGISDRPPTP